VTGPYDITWGQWLIAMGVIWTLLGIFWLIKTWKNR
jgi:hypothetical protein